MCDQMTPKIAPQEPPSARPGVSVPPHAPERMVASVPTNFVRPSMSKETRSARPIPDAARAPSPRIAPSNANCAVDWPFPAIDGTQMVMTPMSVKVGIIHASSFQPVGRAAEQDLTAPLKRVPRTPRRGPTIMAHRVREAVGTICAASGRE